MFTVNSGSFSIFRSICLFLNLAIHFSENLGIFRVALLFICQRSVILRCCCSQRQLRYLIMTAFVCQQLFLIFSNLFSNRKTFVSAVDFHTTILFPALSTTFYIYFCAFYHTTIRPSTSVLLLAACYNPYSIAPTIPHHTFFNDLSIFCTLYLPIMPQFPVPAGTP